jgi:uncharacterized protein (DUF305 family)
VIFLPVWKGALMRRLFREVPMLTRFTLAAVLATALLPGAAPAQTSGTDHAAHAATSATTGPAGDAFRAANDAMHAGMDIAYSGDADIDFALGMMAHHEGAVAMARIVMEYGDDPEIRALAEGIIAAQEAEIAWMRDWLARRRPPNRDNSTIRLFLRQIGAT